MIIDSKSAKLILVAFMAILSNSAFTAPEITIIKGDNNKSFGTHYGKDSPLYSYVVGNVGDELLVIKGVNKTCGGCVEISLSEKEISPGKTAEIKLRLVPGTLSGPYSKNFFVETNDPKQRFVMFTFSGTSVPVAEIKPSNLMYIGKIVAGASCRREFLVIPTEKGAEFGEPVSECNYSANVSSSPSDKGLNIFFSFLPEKNIGDMKCKIKIPVLRPEGWPPLEIIVSAAIAGRDDSPSRPLRDGGFGETALPNAARENKLAIAVIEYFHQAGCSDCRMIDTFIIPKIEENFKGKFRIEKYDTAVMDNFLRFAYRRDKLDIKGNETICMIVNGKHAFNGYKPTLF